jgi:type II secretion system protein H
MTSTTGRRNSTSRSRKGFTLLELIFVMLIVSIIAGLAVPSLRGFLLGRKSADAAAQLIALSQYARTQSASSGSVYRLNVDAQSRTYWLSSQRGAAFQELGNEFGRRFSLPDDTTPEWQGDAREFIEFFPDGRVESAVLLLTEANGKTTAIGCRSETEPLCVLEGEALSLAIRTTTPRGMR